MGVSPVQFESKSTRDFFQVGSMSRHAPWLVLFALLLLFTAACTNKKVSNPLANVGSKQPDKVLFDRAMDAMKHNRFDVARMTLQTLINTYPDSEYIARAKLAVADSWYAEGGTAALTQAEIEYKDFETFFPAGQEMSLWARYGFDLNAIHNVGCKVEWENAQSTGIDLERLYNSLEFKPKINAVTPSSAAASQSRL